MKPHYYFTAYFSLLCLTACSGHSGNGDNASENFENESVIMLVGSYAPKDSSGIKMYSFNPADTTAIFLSGLSGISNPSYQAASPNGRYVYSVGEDNGLSSTANFIRLDNKTNTLQLVESVETEGGAPCYVAIAPEANFIVTANYMGGSVSIFPVDSTGNITGTPELIEFTGHGEDSVRQSQPHAHCATFTPDNKYMLVTDLGTDRIHMIPMVDNYPDLENLSDIVLEPESGPRHIVFHPDNRHAYLINEISGTVTVLDYNDETLSPIQYIASDTIGAKGSGDIKISSDGRFVYASNRLKADGIAVFSVDPDNGLLTKINYTFTGPHPRNIAISPDGNFLFVACRDSDEIEIYGRDAKSGLLTDTGRRIKTPRPVCVTFVTE